MSDKQLFIGTLRIFIHTDTEVEAVLATSEITDLVEDFLDDEDGDKAELTQLTQFTTDVEPSETLTILAHARNVLIKTRIKDCFDMAQSLDQMIHSLRYREASGLLPPYDYSGFMETANDILTNGANPL